MVSVVMKTDKAARGRHPTGIAIESGQPKFNRMFAKIEENLDVGFGGADDGVLPAQKRPGVFRRAWAKGRTQPRTHIGPQ